MVTVVTMFMGTGAVRKTPSPSTRPSLGAVRRQRSNAQVIADGFPPHRTQKKIRGQAIE